MNNDTFLGFSFFFLPAAVCIVVLGAMCIGPTAEPCIDLAIPISSGWACRPDQQLEVHWPPGGTTVAANGTRNYVGGGAVVICRCNAPVPTDGNGEQPPKGPVLDTDEPEAP